MDCVGLFFKKLTRIKSNKKVFYVQTRPYVEDPFGAKIYGRKSVIKKVKISR